MSVIPELNENEKGLDSLRPQTLAQRLDPAVNTL